jgi:hypothetical protein
MLTYRKKEIFFLISESAELFVSPSPQYLVVVRIEYNYLKVAMLGFTVGTTD